MGGVKAGVRIRVKNAGWWYPPVEDRSRLLPLLPRALTTTNQYVSPQSIDASLEDAQLIDIAGDSMVLVVAGDNTPKPYTDLAGAIMLTASKLSLDELELRNHALFRSDPPDGEGQPGYQTARKAPESSLVWKISSSSSDHRKVRQQCNSCVIPLPRQRMYFGVSKDLRDLASPPSCCKSLIVRAGHLECALDRGLIGG